MATSTLIPDLLLEWWMELKVDISNQVPSWLRVAVHQKGEELVVGDSLQLHFDLVEHEVRYWNIDPFRFSHHTEV